MSVKSILVHLANDEQASARSVTMCETQRKAVDFLSQPETFGVARVEQIETHISIVFLAGDRAYKLKRAMRLPFLDFSSAEKRDQMCRARSR